MSANPIRVATAALSERIFAGRPTKDGMGFKEPRYDVTSDVLVAIRDKVGVGNEIDVGLAGTGTMFRIAVLPLRPVDEPPTREQLQDRITKLEAEKAELLACLCEVEADMADDDAKHALNWGHAKDALATIRATLSRIGEQS